MRIINADRLVKELKQEDEPIDIGGVIDLVEEQPTVETEPVVHAHWVEFDWENPQSFDGTAWRYRCSNCGFEEMYESNYCPYCGARMDDVTE